MTTTTKASGQQALAPPRGAAIAGVIFSVLMIVCLGLVRYAMPADLAQPDPWLVEPGRRRAVGLALDLVPFAGIAFLWFVGVLRNRLGELEEAPGTKNYRMRRCGFRLNPVEETVASHLETTPMAENGLEFSEIAEHANHRNLPFDGVERRTITARSA